MPMTNEYVKKYELALAAEKDRLVKELQEVEKPENFGDDVDDTEGIEASEAEDLGNRLAIGQTLRNRINEIDSALNSIASGHPPSEESLKKISGVLAPEPGQGS